MLLKSTLQVSETFWLIIGGIVGLSIMFLLWIYLPAKLAKNRGRSALGWVLLSYITTPFLACILLLIVGNSTEKILRDMQQEKEQQQ